MPDEMSKYRLSEIANGGHFFVHDPEGGDLARIEAKLKELKDKVRGTTGGQPLYYNITPSWHPGEK